MKFLFKLVVLLFLLGALPAGCTVQKPDTGAAGASGKIRIGVDPYLPPFESLDSNNTPAGFDIELIKAVMAKAGLEYQIINVGFNLSTLLDKCQIEMGISAIPITDSLKAQMLFSDPYYTTGYSVVVKKGNLTLTGGDQLAGMTVGTQAGTPSEIEIGKIQGAKLKPFGTFSLAFLDLANGYIDAVIADTARAQNFVNVKRYNLKIVGAEFGSVQYGIGVCKGRPDLLKQINDGLATLKTDGTLDKLISGWIPVK